MTEVYKGSTSHSIAVVLTDATTGLPKTGVAYTDVAAYYTRTRSAAVAITLAALASATTAFAAGGWYEVDATNSPGLYRLDVTNTAFSNSASVDEVVVTVKATGCITVHRAFTLIAINKQSSTIGASVESVQNDSNAAVKLALFLYGWSAETSPGTQASAGLFQMATDYNSAQRFNVNLTHIGGTAISFAAGDVTTARFTKLDNLDATISSRHAAGAAVASVTGNVSGNVVGSVGSVTAGVSLANGAITAAKLAADALLAIANKVEAEIIDETDSEKVLSAITDKIAAVNPDLGGLTVGAIASAARDAVLNAVLAGNFDTAGSLGKLAQFLDAAVSEASSYAASASEQAMSVADAIAGGITIAGIAGVTLPASVASQATAAQIASDVGTITTTLGTLTTDLSTVGGNVDELLAMTTGTGVNRAFTVAALANAPAGEGGGGGGSSAADVWAYANRTLTNYPASLQLSTPQGGAGAYIPGGQSDPGPTTHRLAAIAGQTVVVLSRVTGIDGDYIEQADIASISVAVSNQTDTTEATTTTTPTVSSSVYDELQADGRWTEDGAGYNVALIISGARLSQTNCTYRVTATLTDQSGNPILIRWDVQTS